MTNTLTVRVKCHDGDVLLPAEAMALLLGVPALLIEQHRVDNGVMSLPDEWIRQGRRRASEAKAHTGSDAMLDSLKYWARKDHNAQLEIVYEETPA
ncbi:hypothetical protein A5633_03010 [Mycolicibacterium elephantis]|uniref:hypothetical protein n=1 Tax=Mycolicibacterium elephantis TaxID=81858 RepID=UPI0007EC290E|nr:hypothetical protein [Mycolicibacterium elephantis]OBA66048.1 hypothetical protein A5633_03010 [Mycolicibacterium elephantis]